MECFKSIGFKSIAVLNHSLSQAPRWSDALLLIVFTVWITCNPYYLNNRINMYELSLYLPGINAIQQGLVPFRDFFHLRGPLELYMPTWLMNYWGTHVGVLCGYFFVGNVLCLVAVVLIARELIRSRFIFYMMIPVIIARTFPRVCFMNWGGMRYVFGLMAVFALIRFLKSKHPGWMIASGFMTAAAALTSVEIGVCAAMAVLGSLLIGGMSRYLTAQEAKKGFLYFTGFAILGALPWVIYSLTQQAFIPYLDALWTIITRFLIVINTHLSSVYPRTLVEAFVAMINPGHVNFKQLTPAYAYLVMIGYLVWAWRKGQFRILEVSVLALGLYGVVMYQMAFRALLASQFEMALMPEKVIYFFLIEAAVLWLWQKKDSQQFWVTAVISVLLIGLFCSSLGYSIARFNKRFWVAQWTAKVLSGKNVETLKYADKNEEYERLTMERVKDIWVPLNQAKEFKELNQFFNSRTQKTDTVLMFPELGIYNFIFDRPFLGRFPMSDLSWLSEQWFDEYFNEFKTLKAKYVVFQKKMPEDWEKTYFGYAPNKDKYDQMMMVLKRSYIQVTQTEESWIYERIR